jgi:hypothetical protein
MMADDPPTVKKVYVSGWLEYRIDNPNALGDASAFTPNEVDPEHKTNLQSVPEWMYRLDAAALVLEVGKRFQLPRPTIPGATCVNSGGVKITTTPPAGQAGPHPQSA